MGLSRCPYPSSAGVIPYASFPYAYQYQPADERANALAAAAAAVFFHGAAAPSVDDEELLNLFYEESQCRFKG